MPNLITKHFEKITGKKYTNADLLNAIREKTSDSFKADIPVMSSMKPINHANVPYTNYELHENEFFDVLINRIGTIIIKALHFENPLGVFRSETFEYGETLQELYIELAEAEDFNAKSDESPFKYAGTNVRVFYHDLNREKRYDRTIERAWTQKAFLSENSFDEFIDKMFMSLYSSDELDEFEKIKSVITNSLTPINVAPVGQAPLHISTRATEWDVLNSDFMVEFNKELIKRTNLMAVPSRSRFENASGVPKSTPLADQYLIVSADFSAELDSMLANAFNMDKASVLAKKIIIDEFPTYEGSGSHNGAKPFAALISKESLILKDKLVRLENIYNPKTLSYNYFLHHHQTVSFSMLENAHIYYTKPEKP